MDGSRSGVSRRARLQALALAVVLPADGLAAYLLGAPAWIALLYLALGIVLAALRLHFGRVRAVVPAPQSLEAIAATEPEPEPEPEPVDRAIGYVCVPSAANGDLREQTALVTSFCAEHGLQLQSVVHDVECPPRDQRPSLAWALEQLAAEKAETLVVARLRDLSGNVANLAPLLSWFNSERRRLIAIDLQLDTSTEAGRLAAGAVAGVGGWEHERMSERTRRGLEAARSRGTGIGRSAVADIPELKERIEAMREEGMTLQAIADVLNAEGVPTLRGGTMWRPSSVQRATGYRRPSSGSRGIELPKPGSPER
jgi:DNA invertase Pin-like site-specific DNA recombinase